MKPTVEAIIKQTNYSTSAEIINVNGIIGERFIKLYPNDLDIGAPSYIVPGTDHHFVNDNFIGVSFSCSKTGFIIYFSSGFREVQLAKQDKIHFHFETGSKMVFNMFSGKLKLNGYNMNLTNLEPIQLAYFCENRLDHVVAENGRTGLQLQVAFHSARNNDQYMNSSSGQNLLMMAAQIIGTTQKNLNTLS